MRGERVVGVDGARVGKISGWVSIAVEGTSAGTRFVSAEFHATFGEVLALHPSASILAVDIPIGLVREGRRACDLAVRELLRGRSSTLFATPPRAAVEASSYEEACILAERLMGVKISRQSWGLIPRILEVDAFRADPRLYEVHPELSFSVLAGEPLPSRKKSWAGQAARRRLLTEAGIELPDDLGEAGRVPPDDVLDAAVAAWTALRIVRSEATTVPDQNWDADGAHAIAIHA